VKKIKAGKNEETRKREGLIETQGRPGFSGGFTGGGGGEKKGFTREGITMTQAGKVGKKGLVLLEGRNVRKQSCPK